MKLDQVEVICAPVRKIISFKGKTIFLMAIVKSTFQGLECKLSLLVDVKIKHSTVRVKEDNFCKSLDIPRSYELKLLKYTASQMNA